MRRLTWGSVLRLKRARRKVVSTKHFIKAKVQSQCVRVGRFSRVGPAPRLFWDWILLVLSELVGAVMYPEMVSNGGYFQSFGKFLPQVGRGSFDPARFVCYGTISQGGVVGGCACETNAS